MAAHVGVAISGGGHRAAAWGFGALLALVDARANARVVSVASVSGGSIANGVTLNEVDYATCNGTTYESAIAPSLRLMASEGLFFRGNPTDAYVCGVLGAVALLGSLVASLLFGVASLAWTLNRWTGLLVGLGLGAIAAVVLGRKAKKASGQPNAWPPALSIVLVVALLLAGPMAVVAASSTPSRRAVGIVAGVVVLVVGFGLVLVWFGRRSVVVDHALGRTLLRAADGAPTRLADKAGTAVHHVFCATELQSGNHCYLSPELVTTYQVGYFGTLGDLALSTAVQASACLPGAFRARRIGADAIGTPMRPWPVPSNRPDPARFDHLLLNDGGVYDNMADQWEHGFANRAERLAQVPGLRPYQSAPADFLVVVNAGAGMEWDEDTKRSAAGREIDALMRSVDVVYDVSTALRRSMLVDRFQVARELSDEQRARLHVLDGLVVHISRMPSAFAKQWEGDDRIGRRAAEVPAVLAGAGVDEERFAGNGGVATTLGRLGTDAVTDLLHHAYLLTTVGLYIIAGIGDLEGGAGRFGRARFAALAAGQAPAATDG